jgi:hypothetical protein
VDRKAIGELVRVVEDLMMAYAAAIEPEDAERVSDALETVREILGEEDHAYLDKDTDIDDFVEEREDHFLTDTEADADALRSIGWGTDEDYGGGMEYI